MSSQRRLVAIAETQPGQTQAVARVLADAEGRVATASLVAFHKTDKDDIRVGDCCLALLEDPDSSYDVVLRPKRVLGRTGAERGDVDRDALRLSIEQMRMHMPEPAEVAMDERKGGVMIKCRNGVRTTPMEAMALLIADKMLAARAVCKVVRNDRFGMVVTVPAYWTTSQRETLRASFRAAGVDDDRILRIVQEPTAAVFGLVLKDPEEHAKLRAAQDGLSTIAVFDLGGGTFDVSVIEVRHSIVFGEDNIESRVRLLDGDLWLGGGDLEEALAARLAADLKVASGHEARAAAVGLMHAMSKTQPGGVAEFQCAACPACPDGFIRMSEAEMVEIVDPQLERIRKVVGRIAAKLASVADVRVSRVLAVGGPTRIPFVVRCFREALSGFGIYDGPVESFVDSAVTLVVEGAALLARALLDGAKVTLKDMTAFGVGVAVREDSGRRKIIHMLPPSSPVDEKFPSDDQLRSLDLKSGVLIPSMLTNASSSSRNSSVLFNIYEGLSDVPEENAHIGSFSVKFSDETIDAHLAYLGVTERVPAGKINMLVQFSVSDRGSAHIVVYIVNPPAWKDPAAPRFIGAPTECELSMSGTEDLARRIAEARRSLGSHGRRQRIGPIMQLVEQLRGVMEPKERDSLDSFTEESIDGSNFVEAEEQLRLMLSERGVPPVVPVFELRTVQAQRNLLVDAGMMARPQGKDDRKRRANANASIEPVIKRAMAAPAAAAADEDEDEDEDPFTKSCRLVSEVVHRRARLVERLQERMQKASPSPEVTALLERVNALDKATPKNTSKLTKKIAAVEKELTDLIMAAYDDDDDGDE